MKKLMAYSPAMFLIFSLEVAPVVVGSAKVAVMKRGRDTLLTVGFINASTTTKRERAAKAAFQTVMV
jgi:hypothetical protein